MGLCKCPLRKVTNLFCFEHRVNVCEHCIVKRHPKVSRNLDLDQNVAVVIQTQRLRSLHVLVSIVFKMYSNCFLFQCVIKSYLDWLQDSDYDPNCPICHQDLTTEQCVRLTCYRKSKFHFSATSKPCNYVRLKRFDLKSNYVLKLPLFLL